MIYPVDGTDPASVAEGLNYLLSGPAGLGQNFAGTSFSNTVYLRPATQAPFTTPVVPPVTTSDGPQINNEIAISAAQGCLQDGTPTSAATRFFEVTWSSAQATAPYSYGDQVMVVNVTDTYPTPPATRSFNGGLYRVWTSTTTTAILYDTTAQIWPTYTSGGAVASEWLNVNLSTDCDTRVLVQSASDRVFVTGKVNMLQLVHSNFGPLEYTNFTLRARIVRSRAFEHTQPGNSDYLWLEPTVIAEIYETYFGVSGSSPPFPPTVEPAREWDFSTIIDGPNLPTGYYRYQFEFYFDTVDIEGTGGAGAFQVASGDKVLTAAPVTYANVATFQLLSSSTTTARVTVDLTASPAEPYSNVNTTVAVVQAGEGFELFEQVRVLGNALGGITPDNDLIITVTDLTTQNIPLIQSMQMDVRSISVQVVKE